MDGNFQVLLILLLKISKLLIICPIIVFIVEYLMRRMRKGIETVHVGINRRLVIFAACMMFSIWCLRLSVGIYGIVSGTEKEPLTLAEEFFNSLVHTFQSFSMDEDYTSYITSGRAMMNALYPAEPTVAKLYGIYASVMNCAAPVAGGAIIFEIIASIFPTIFLRLSYIAFWREKYYFSELNDNVLAFVKSLNKENSNKFFTRPVVIITDSYVDKQNERSVELALKAKLLDTICVKNDIVHIPKNLFGSRKIILADENESNNLYTLVELSSTLKKGLLSNTEIFYLSLNDIPSQVSEQVRENLKKNFGDNITFLPVNVHRNLVTNMLVEIPLFEPIVSEYNEFLFKKSEIIKDSHESNITNEVLEPLELNVTIIGSGQIGTEMFLATYSLGQILDCRLNIQVYSKEDKAEFKQRINYINPNIFDTMDIADEELNISPAENPLLQIYRKEVAGKVYADKYCSLSYTKIDVKSEDFFKMFGTSTIENKTHYFMIALGSDEENVLVANKLKEAVGRRCLFSTKATKSVITYVVFNSKLQRLLNTQTMYSYNKGVSNIYMKAIGSLDDTYCVNNIFMQSLKPLIEAVGQTYNSHISVENRRTASQRMAGDEYNFSADVARAAHVRYKIFSAGLWKRSVFDMTSDEYKKAVEDFKKEYRKKIEQFGEYAEEMASLAWLEHRRWNAYMRTRGFTAPADMIQFVEKCGSQKDVGLKLHACIVECDRNGVKHEKFVTGEKTVYPMIDTELNEKQFDELKPDKLDDVSRKVALVKGQGNSDDYKIYDYPIGDLKR